MRSTMISAAMQTSECEDPVVGLAIRVYFGHNHMSCLAMGGLLIHAGIVTILAVYT